MSNTAGSLDPDGIRGEQTFIFINTFGEFVDEILYLAPEIERRIEGDASNAEIRRHHALAGDVLENPE